LPPLGGGKTGQGGEAGGVADEQSATVRLQNVAKLQLCSPTARLGLGRRVSFMECELMRLSGLGLIGAALISAACATAASAQDRYVRIHNDTSVTLYRFYSTDSGSDRWGNDVMGSSTLEPGRSMRLNFDNKYGYCLFDFKAEFADGEVLERSEVNVCEIADYYYQE
jgi:hypothetical protein